MSIKEKLIKWRTVLVSMFFAPSSRKTWFSFFIVFLIATSTSAIGISNEESEPKESLSEKIRFAESLSSQMQKDPTDNESLAKLYAQLGELYFYDEQFTKAIDYYVRSLVLRDKNPDKLSSFGAKTPWLLIDIGNVLYRMGEIVTAKNIYIHALQIFQSKKDMRGVTTSLNNLGLCFLALKQFNEASGVFRTSYQLSQEIKDNPCRYVSGVYVAISLKENGKNKEALYFLREIESIPLRPEDEPLNAYHLLEMGDAYLKLKNIDSARAVLNRLAFDRQMPNIETYRLEALLKLSDIEKENNNYSEALSYGNSAWELVQHYPNNSLKLKISHQLYSLFKGKADFGKALYFHEQFEIAQSSHLKNQLSVYVEDYNRRIDRISNHWEKKQYLLEQKAAIQEKNTQMQLGYFLVATSILLIIMIISGKGTETRINALQEYIGSLTGSNKRNLTIAILLYFLAFHFIFSPVGIARDLLNTSLLYRLYPGLIAVFTVTTLLFLFFRTRILRKCFKGNCKNHYLISFGVIQLVVFMVLTLYYMGFEGTGLNFMLSLFMLILASFIFPIYAGILIIEKVIIKHIEQQASIIAGGLAQKNAEEVVEEEKIVLESEKTNGKLEFYLKNLLFVESQGNYCMFYLETSNGLRKKMLHTTMKSVENQLSGNKYVVRCHKSFIVNIQRIKNVSGNSRGYELHFGNGAEVVPVSRGYQNDVMGFIRDYIDGNS